MKRRSQFIDATGPFLLIAVFVIAGTGMLIYAANLKTSKPTVISCDCSRYCEKGYPKCCETCRCCEGCEK